MEFFTTPIGKILVGVILLVLGLSFAWKGWMACVMGRFYYWEGFLPFTVISPWLIHLPPSKRSLVKAKEGMLAHIIMGPSFFLCAILALCAGADMIGWPGTTTLNLVINGLDRNKDTAVSFDPDTGRYSFPMLKKSGGKLYTNLFESKIDEDHDILGRKIEHVLPTERKNIDGQTVDMKRDKVYGK